MTELLPVFCGADQSETIFPIGRLIFSQEGAPGIGDGVTPGGIDIALAGLSDHDQLSNNGGVGSHAAITLALSGLTTDVGDLQSDLSTHENDNTLHSSIFPIWAEENGNVTPGVGQEYSFGNGATSNTATPSGITLPLNCELFSITITALGKIAGFSSFSTNVLINGSVVATSNVAASSGAENMMNSVVTLTPGSVLAFPGNVINFTTATRTGTVGDVVVTAWFRTV